MEKYLKERKRKYLSKATNNCQFSRKAKVDDEFDILICSRYYDGGNRVMSCYDERCNDCPIFECKKTSEDVKAEFDKIIHNPSLCGEEYPKLYTLLWVLGGDLSEKDISEQPKKSFWRKLLNG
jgi:hypothetical protein